MSLHDQLKLNQLLNGSHILSLAGNSERTGHMDNINFRPSVHIGKVQASIALDKIVSGNQTVILATQLTQCHSTY